MTPTPPWMPASSAAAARSASSAASALCCACMWRTPAAVSCCPRRIRGAVAGAGAWVGRLVAGGGMFAFLAPHRQDLFADAEFEDLFPSGRGRPSIPASVMASILVLKTLHDLSDRETADAARCEVRWKVATGMALDHNGFDPSTLVYWRKRLAKSTRPHRINEAGRRGGGGAGGPRGDRQ